MAQLPRMVYGLILIAGMLVLIPGIVKAQSGQAKVFDVASIKPSDPKDFNMSISRTPGKFNARGITVKGLIENAYHLYDFQVAGTPQWAESIKYDISAKADAGQENPRHTEKTPAEEMLENEQCLQSLLIDRFQLQFERRTQQKPAYALVVRKNGPRMQRFQAGGEQKAGTMEMQRGRLAAHGMSMQLLARNLAGQVGRVVIDKTGLSDLYDVTLEWTPAEVEAANDISNPPLITAIREQLGLDLVPQKGPVEMFVIHHLEKPSPN